MILPEKGGRGKADSSESVFFVLYMGLANDVKVQVKKRAHSADRTRFELLNP
jgi:hypothetical protein